MRRRVDDKRLITALVGVAALQACNDTPVSIATDPSLETFGRDNGGVTVPIEVRFDGGTFVVVPFGDPRIPPGTPTENCPGGEANPELAIPAGFPNGGGVVVIEGTGHARKLGRFRLVQTQCGVQFFPATDPPLVNFDLRSTIIVADGSQLFIRGDFATTPFTPADVRRPVFDIVGGTERFQGAAGVVHQSMGGTVTCTDATPFCLEGTFTGGVSEGEITMPRP